MLNHDEVRQHIARIRSELTIEGREPLSGDVIDAVVTAGICGRGLAQKLDAELRKAAKTSTAERSELVAPVSIPDDVLAIVAGIGQLHQVVDDIMRTVALSVAAKLTETRLSLGTIIAEQDASQKRALELSEVEIDALHGRIDELEFSLALAMDEAAQAAERLTKVDAERADLFTRMTEAENERDTLLAHVTALENERDQHQTAAAMLRADLETYRHDLASARQVEASLRDELHRFEAGQIDRAEHITLVAKYEALNQTLSHETARSAELHARLLSITGMIARASMDSAAISAAPS